MKRARWLWLAFLFCLAVVLVAMGWLTRAALRLDQSRASARRQAALEENVRLALWRMDSALAPLVAQESARPYFVYNTFLPVGRAYGRMFQNRRAGEPLLPSPLLAETDAPVLLYFQISPEGRFTSPRVPDAAERSLAVPAYLAGSRARAAEAQLSLLEKTLPRERLLAALPKNVSATADVVFMPGASMPGGGEPGAQSRGGVELHARNVRLRQQTNVMVLNQAVGMSDNLSPRPTDLGGSLMTPLWLGDRLLLARRVTIDGRELVQGCVMDWPQIRRWLLDMVGDLLPGAELEPVAASNAETESRRLAALPLALRPGRLPEELVYTAQKTSTTAVSLVVAWTCVLLAAGAVAVLLAGVVRLSQRRADFVSAVTHELRTPLTTFHMYAEMLAEDMVPDPDTRQHYLRTLQSEAARLSHLVENVLAYARLERGRTDGRREELDLQTLVDRVAERLAARAAQAGDGAERGGMELVVESEAIASSARVCVNPSVVEQILLNLVDNACKYAADAADRRLHLEIAAEPARVLLAVRDHGPGVSPSVASRLFRPFTKSAREAAHSAPGIGLGLALSRRLARDLGGELWLDRDNASGTRFVLAIPKKTRGQTHVMGDV